MDGKTQSHEDGILSYSKNLMQYQSGSQRVFHGT